MIKTRLIKILIGIVGIFILFYGLRYLYVSNKTYPITWVQNDYIIVNETATPTERAEWSTYRHSMGKYSIQYPKDFDINEYENITSFRLRREETNVVFSVAYPPYIDKNIEDYNSFKNSSIKFANLESRNPYGDKIEGLQLRARETDLAGRKVIMFESIYYPEEISSGTTIYVWDGSEIAEIYVPDVNNKDDVLLSKVFSTLQFSN